jgi:ATP-dependent RNA helicase DeaD
MVAKNLRLQGVKVEMLHGKLSQNKRLSVLKDLDTGRTNILVSSPVAARGLDIKDITHIFNYDLSPDPQEYIHRIGRTARAGESGKAITLLSTRDHDAFSGVLKNFDVKVELLPKEKFEKVQFDSRRMPRESGSGRGGNRGRRSFQRGPPRSDSPRQVYGRKPGFERRSDDSGSSGEGFNRGGGHRRNSGGGFSRGPGGSGRSHSPGGYKKDKSPRFGN